MTQPRPQSPAPNMQAARKRPCHITTPSSPPSHSWQSFLAAHPPRHRLAILVLVDGGTMREAGKLFGIGDSAAAKLKRRIAADLVEFFGFDVIRRLIDGCRPGWESDLRQSRERHLCHVSAGREAAVPVPC
jgi:hypothetical protein